MKKITIYFAILATALLGCKKNIVYDFSIITPTGAASVAFYNIAGDANFETNSTPSNILNMMVTNSKDVIVIDTFGGIQQIKNNSVEYTLAGVITFGNFFIYSTKGDQNINITSESRIYSFGQNQVPDKTFKALFPNASNIEYATNGVAGTNSVMCTGKAGTQDIDYVFTAQPVLQSVLNNSSCTTAKKYFSVQEVYQEKFGTKGFPQAAVFVKNSVITDKKAQLNKFLSDLKEDIEKGIANPDLIEEGMNKIEEPTAIFGVTPTLAKQVTESNNGLGLGFEYGFDIKEQLKQYFINIQVDVGQLNDNYFYKP